MRGLSRQVGRDRFLVEAGAQRILFPHKSFLAQEVDHPTEMLFPAKWELQQQGRRSEPAGDLFHHAVKVRAHTVELVNEDDTGHPILIRLVPDGLGLRLDSSHPTEHYHRAVEDAQAALDFRSEVNVPWGVDNIDLMAVPFAGDRGGGNGDATLAFLGHPVGHRGTVVHLADFVRDPGIVEHALTHRGLATVHVRHDADVTNFL